MTANTTILAVMSDANDAETLMQALRLSPYDVILATTPDEALAHLDSSLVLVVSDIGPGKPGGRDMIQQWRSRRPHVPFLLIADNNGFDTAQISRQLGLADCLRKPLNSAEFLSRVAETMDESRKAAPAPASDDTHSDATRRPPAENTTPPSFDIPPGATLQALERAAIEQTLQRHQGNRTHAAKALGISVRTLQRKLKAWQASPPSNASRRSIGTTPRDNWSTKPDPTRAQSFKPRYVTA